MKNLIYIFVVLMLSACSIFAQNSNTVFHQEVTWSPDGKHLSFTTYRKLDPNSNQIKSEVYVMKADGTGVQKIADDARWSSWSAGGKRILFSRTSADNKTSNLFTVKTDGSDLIQLTKDAKRNAHPAFSPDGKKIAFTSTRDSDKNQIYVMNSDGTNVRRLTTDSTIGHYSPTWSPDSKRLVYYAEKGDRKDQVWTMNLDGSHPTLLTNNIGNNTYPAWSPDGKRIIFTSNRDGEVGAIYTMNSANGSNAKRLAGVKSFFARYSPKGKKIAFISGSFPSTSVFIANVDGLDAKKLLPK